MESINIRPANENDLIPFSSNLKDVSLPLVSLHVQYIIVGILLGIVLAFILTFILYKLKKDIAAMSIVVTIPLGITGSIILMQHLHENTLMNIELKERHPQVRSLSINGTINHINHIDDSNAQKIQFKDKQHTYYVTIPDCISVKPNDDIKIDINNQIIDKTIDSNNLSESINPIKSNVIIKNNESKYKTSIIKTNQYKTHNDWHEGLSELSGYMEPN